MTKLYGTIWGQFPPALQSEDIGNKEYKEKSSSFDCVWLLRKLQKLCAGLDTHSYVYVTTHSAIKAFYTRSSRSVSPSLSEAAVDIVGMSLGSIFDLPDLLVYEQDTFVHSTKEEAKERIEAKYLVVDFL